MSSRTPEVSKLGHGNQRPKMELARAFMPVLITSNFDGESIKINSRQHEDTFVPLK